MSPRTEEFLYVLLWTADSFLRPTWRNATQDFDSWAWNNGLARRLADLERRRLVELAPENLRHSLVRLTDAGRLAALGGRDPERQWNRSWDGHWRIILFDIPVEQHSLRVRLWRNLRRQGFGFLQNSVWITPDPIERARLAETAEVPSVENIVVIDGQPCGGETNEALVGGAWDFEEINRRYGLCSRILDAFPRGTSFEALRSWTRDERAAWAQAIRIDPFLPRGLGGPDYLGPKVWAKRIATLQRLRSAAS